MTFDVPRTAWDRDPTACPSLGEAGPSPALTRNRWPSRTSSLGADRPSSVYRRKRKAAHGRHCHPRTSLAHPPVPRALLTVLLLPVLTGLFVAAGTGAAHAAAG